MDVPKFLLTSTYNHSDSERLVRLHFIWMSSENTPSRTYLSVFSYMSLPMNERNSSHPSSVPLPLSVS